MNNTPILGLILFSFNCIFSYGYYKLIYLKDQTIENPYTRSDTLKSLIIGNLISILITATLINTPSEYFIFSNQSVFAGSSILLYLIIFITGRYNSKGTNSVVFTTHTYSGFICTSSFAFFADLHTSVLLLCVLSLQYIALATGWSFTRKFVKFTLFMTLARALTTILYSDLIQAVYMQAQLADYLLDIVSYYVVFTITLGHWIKYSFYKKKPVQNLPELLVIEIKE
jgi:hypothetical protein